MTATKPPKRPKRPRRQCAAILVERGERCQAFAQKGKRWCRPCGERERTWSETKMKAKVEHLRKELERLAPRRAELAEQLRQMGMDPSGKPD